MTGIAAGRDTYGQGVGSPTASAAPSLAERLLQLAERSHGWACALLLALGLLCLVPGFASLQPMDRDEPRFAQASKQMVETGDFVDIRFQDEVRYKKPIGIHWLQVASVRAAETLGLAEARTTIAVYRIPSLAGALAAVLLTYWAALAFGERRAAFLAAALMAASVILAVEARLAKTDAMLLGCSVAAMGALARIYFARDGGRPSTGIAAIFWLALAAGILIKGPMLPLFAGLCGVALSLREGSARWLLALRPLPGLLFTALAVAPWFAAIAWKSGGEFYRLAVGDDMLGKVATGQQNHFAPPGFYLAAFFATFWPGAALAAIAAPFAWANRHRDDVAFCLAWIVPAWLVFEAIPTKLPHYVMPLYPAVAIMTVLAVSAGAVGPHRPGARLTALLVPLIPLGIAFGLAYGAWTLDGALPLAALPVFAVSVGLAIWAWTQFAAGAGARSMVTGVAASVALCAGVFGLTQPALPSLKLSPRLAALVRRAPCPDPLVATLGYREPSLVFLVGTALDMVETGAEAVAFLRGEGCRVLLVTDRLTPAFEAARGPEGLAVARFGEVRGFNINGGRRVTIDAYTARR